jgi:hypothetical protein
MTKSRSNSKPRNLGRRLAKIARKTELTEADQETLAEISNFLRDIHSLILVHVRRFARAAADSHGVEFRHACGRHPHAPDDALMLLGREALRIDACIGLDCSEKPPVWELAKFLISERRFQ